MLASHTGGPGSIPGQDMSVLGPLEEYSNDPGQVRDNIKYFYVSVFGKVAVNIDNRGKHFSLFTFRFLVL